ncbi:hypothetical protein BJV74DRAFT_91749 [Russula compacta]|nr:hypothetical protein BJV74DRAFT_91749 [Russula compacta]
MSSRVDSAIPTRLSSIRNELIGKKLRVGSVPWLREPRSTVTLLGYLEPCQTHGVGGTACPRQATEMRLPELIPAQLPHEDMVLITHMSLQAILVLDSPNVDLRLWNETVAEMEASGVL